MGIEPTWPAWEAGALPLSYTRVTRGGFHHMHPNYGLSILMQAQAFVNINYKLF